jgi:hypothetical protein
MRTSEDLCIEIDDAVADAQRGMRELLSEENLKDVFTALGDINEGMIWAMMTMALGGLGIAEMLGVGMPEMSQDTDLDEYFEVVEETTAQLALRVIVSHQLAEMVIRLLTAAGRLEPKLFDGGDQLDVLGTMFEVEEDLPEMVDALETEMFSRRMGLET